MASSLVRKEQKTAMAIGMLLILVAILALTYLYGHSLFEMLGLHLA